MSVCGLVFWVVCVLCAELLCVDGVGQVLRQVHRPLSPPAPELLEVPGGAGSAGGSGLVLLCRAPAGQLGRVFRLFRLQELVDTVQEDTEQPEARFELQGGAVEHNTHYCCQYDNSLISPYYTIRTPPPDPMMPPPPPRLSVTPPAGRVLPGQVLDFHCQAPPTSPGYPPLLFLLQRRARGAESDQEVGRSSEPDFRVGPVGQNEEGTYTCLYQIILSGGAYNSAPSTPVHISITAHLQTPQLSHADGELVCTGSPSYPGAHFYLYQQGAELPSAQQQVQLGYTARFRLAQPGHSTYQCQYSILLGTDWAHSKLSNPVTLPCTTGSCNSSPPVYEPPPPTGWRVDLALIIGSVSAALLFLLLLFILTFTVHKHVKAAAVKRRQREQDVFWQQLHSRDHVIDLTLQRVNITDFCGSEGRVSVSEPIYDCPFSTFTDPAYK